MAKMGKDEELELLTEEWLRNHDPDYKKKNKGYSNEENLQKKLSKETPISNLSKKERSKIEEEYYSSHKTGVCRYEK